MTPFLNATLAVTGASGHLGRLTIEKLLEAGATRVIGITRDPAKAAGLAARGVEIRAASFDDAGSLPAAFAGVERLLIISTDDLAVPGSRARQHIRAIDAAEAAGVSHIVYTSLTSPYPDPSNQVADSHYWTEVRLAGGRTGWSILRNNQYTDYLIPAAQHALAAGTYHHAAGEGRRAYVTREDCAIAAATALLRGEGRRIYDIGGPEAVSGEEFADILGTLTGKPVSAVSIPAADLEGGLVKGGVPGGLASILARFDSDAGKGYLGIVSGHLEELTGRAPQSVAEFFAANRAALTA